MRLLALGFGFAEVGTVTPLPQAGNPKPRIFRLTSDQAVINRLGFNNQGHARARPASCGARRPRRHRRRQHRRQQGQRRPHRRLRGSACERFADLASYLTVNISSPNTPGLRGMQERQALAELLSRVMAARDEVAPGKAPVFLKIAPDLGEAELADIAAEVLTNKVEGVIVSNTTLARSNLQRQRASRRGGRPVGPATVRALDRSAGAHAAPAWAGRCADRCRRRRFDGDRDRENPRRRRPRAALYRHDFWRPVAARPYRPRPRRFLPNAKRSQASAQLRDSGVDAWARQTYRVTAISAETSV